MERSSILIGLLLLFAFIAPLFYTINIKKKNNAIWEQKIRKKAAQMHLELDELEINTKLFLGINRAKQILIYGNLDEENLKIKSFGLTGITCEIKQNRSKEKGIEQIVMLLKNQLQQSQIVFYNEKDDYNVEALAQLELAQKWQKVLS
ncbi:hypothetical protein [Mesonia sp. HuA40]|uniref:hypothetical protein n=1 Tax=Mesonia sp. HuA40 TaxID=2602761 RepID=UPI0011CA0D54|nr:hypothetical protein [Mesonia sp. HuA40]TXK72691.1 hypothetical protein FT993_07630 [Mesonia sp. HuA40]